MMRKYRSMLILVLALSAFTPAAVQAQETAAPAMIRNIHPALAPEPEPSGPLPDSALGIWSAPDCTDAQSVLVLSRYYQMYMTPGRHTMTVITQWRSEDYDDETLFFYLTHDGLGYFFKMTHDGLIRHLRRFVHPKQELHAAWSDIVAQMSDEYTRCAKLFTGKPVVTQDEVNLPFLLDRVREPCAGVDPENFSKAGACHAALFAAVDSDGNTRLDENELVRFYRQAVFLEGGALAGCRVTPAEEPGSGMTSAGYAPRFAGDALRLGDTDGDAALGLDEVSRVLTSPLSYDLREPLLQKLRSARFAFGFLPLSSAEKSCTTDSPGGKPDVYTGIILLEDKPSPLAPAGGCGCGG